MHRGALLPAMGGLPRRVPPSPGIALLVTPPPQIGPPNGNTSYSGSTSSGTGTSGGGASGTKKQQGNQGAQGAAGGANHKCSRCKARPKSGSGSSLCIRCKLQREYCSPRGGFAGPKKKVPMTALPMTPLSSTAPALSPTMESRNDILQLTPPTSQQLTPTPNTPSGISPSTGMHLGQAPTLSQKTEINNVVSPPLDVKPLIIHLEVAGDLSRSLQWATLGDQEDLTETTWPQCMEELERETDDFRPESLNQVLSVSETSPTHPERVEPCPANVALPAEIVGAMSTSGGSGRARLGLARLPAILSLPEGPQSPSELTRKQPSRTLPPAIASQSVHTINGIGPPNPKMSPAQGVVVTLNIPDRELSNDISNKHCTNSLRQSVTTTTGTDCVIGDTHQISLTATSPNQQIYVPMVSVTTTAASTTLSTASYETPMSFHNHSDGVPCRVDADVWRSHVRRAVRSYTIYLEEAFSALLESPSESKWVTVLSVFQKKTVLSKILQRLSILQRALLPPEEHTSLRRVSRSAEQLFKAMSRLRGEMAAARNTEQRLGHSAIYPLGQAASYPTSPLVGDSTNINDYSSLTSNGLCPTAIPLDTTGDSFSSNTCGIQPATARSSHLDVNSFIYQSGKQQQQQMPQLKSSPIVSRNSPVYNAVPATSAPVDESFFASGISLPGTFITTQKSLTEEADDEISKILAKLKKEDRCTIPQVMTTNSSLSSTRTGSLSQAQQVNTAPSYPLITNGSTVMGHSSSKIDALPSCTRITSASSAVQQQTATEVGVPAQLMARLLSPEFSSQPEAFVGSTTSNDTHSSMGRYNETSVNQTTESLNQTYANIAARETNSTQRPFGQQQASNAGGASIGNRRLYFYDISRPLSQDSNQQSWELAQSQQAMVKTENRTMFSPSLPKKPHVEISRSAVPIVAAPQLRSLLARKSPATNYLKSTQNQCFMNSRVQADSLATPLTVDVLQLSQHQRLYLSPTQEITAYNNEAPKPQKVLPSLPAFSSSLQQKSLYQRGSGASDYSLATQLHDQQQQHGQVNYHKIATIITGMVVFTEVHASKSTACTCSFFLYFLVLNSYNRSFNPHVIPRSNARDNLFFSICC
ncbi:uncharacterized protein LOC111252249 isoform X2 [Varroa destructor]|uniref:Uncharacterized protein n=1 Tax=Varroa destructor TaxID=109461 RepID=A0A7M7MC66_VARDE|nr:uncharacterized protein LOC111252249 isoform X2 [Varroa destructor]